MWQVLGMDLKFISTISPVQLILEFDKNVT